MKGLLDGIRAVELAAFGNGPIIGMILADLGAEVIKIEDRITGDPSRGLMSLHGVDTMSSKGTGVNLLFESVNRGKKSITMDLKKKEGKAAVCKLIAQSDVFFSNYRPASLKRLGMDYDSLAKLNPKLVYANATGFGKEGPDSDKRAFDPIGLARSGMMMAAGERSGPPGEIVGAVADTQGATMTAFGIIGGLLARERYGIGQSIDASLLGSMIWLQYANVSLALQRGFAMKRHQRAKSKNPMVNAYLCMDGKWLKLGEPQSDRFWGPFCRALDMPALENDARFNSSQKRRENCEALVKVLDDVFLKKDRDAWVAHFETNGLKMAYERVLDINEVIEDEQVWANQYIQKDTHPVLGEVKLAQFPVNFSETGRLDHKAPAPEFGQHTEEVLLSLGYEWEDIIKMKDGEVI